MIQQNSLIIYGDTSKLIDENGERKQIADKMSELPTLIYCNPNAGYYESLYNESNWVEFYNSKGINLVVWNYRGYGCSQGSPTPQNLFRDCECLVDYLRQELKAGQIGIHGQSIGGMVATYVANSKKLDFLLADRTFAQFSDIAQQVYGSKIKSLFRMLVDWDFQISQYYIKAQCYKVISIDLKDDMIPYMASLKNGVSKDFAIINNKLHITPMIDFPQIPKPQYSTQSFTQTLKLYAHNSKMQFKKAFEKDMRLEEISEGILSLEDRQQLFNALRRVMEVIRDVSIYRIKGGNRNPQKNNNNTTPTVNKNSTSENKSQNLENKENIDKQDLNAEPQNRINNNLDQQVVNNQNANEINQNMNENNLNVNQSNQYNNESNQNVNENIDLKLKACEIEKALGDVDGQCLIEHDQQNEIELSPSDYNSGERSSILYKQNEYISLEMESTQDSSTICNKYSNTTDSLFSYIQFLNDDIKSDPTFQDFTIHSYSIFDLFDSAGLSLSAIFTSFSIDLQFDIFKVKLNETIQKLNETILKQKTDDHSDGNYHFERMLNEDFTIICSKLGIIKENLIRELMRLKDGMELQVQECEQLEEFSLNYHDTFSNQDRHNPSIGHLLLLNCGHNGLFTDSKLEILEFHLKRSGFCPLNQYRENNY